MISSFLFSPSLSLSLTEQQQLELAAGVLLIPAELPLDLVVDPPRLLRLFTQAARHYGVQSHFLFLFFHEMKRKMTGFSSVNGLFRSFSAIPLKTLKIRVVTIKRTWSTRRRGGGGRGGKRRRRKTKGEFSCSLSVQSGEQQRRRRRGKIHETSTQFHKQKYKQTSLYWRGFILNKQTNTTPTWGEKITGAQEYILYIKKKNKWTPQKLQATDHSPVSF